MALIRWDPFSELNSLHEQVNSLFNDTFGGIEPSRLRTPVTDVYEDDGKLVIEAHLPNFKQEEISINEHEGALEIKAEHKEKQEEGARKRQYFVRESVNHYYRRFALPKNSDIGKVEAHFDNGVLKVQVPYKELPKPKQIAIKAKNK